MNSFPFWYSGEATVVWVVNVLLQVTLVTSLSLLAARFLKGDPVVRRWVLCFALLIVVASPVTALLRPSGGVGLFTVSLLPDAHHRSNVGGDVAAVDTLGNTTGEERRSQVVSGLRRSADRSALPTPGGPTTAPPNDASSLIPMDSSSRSPDGRAANVATRANREARELTSGATLVILLGYATSVLLPVWVVGSLVSLIRFLRSWWKLANVLHGAEPVVDGRVHSAASLVASRLNLTRPPRIAASRRVTVPMVGGVLRPRLILPHDILDRITDDQLRDVLVHECAHAMRWDPALALAQNVAAVFMWFHPLVHVLNTRLAQACEEVCDNHVLELTDGPSYSRTLLRLAEHVDVRERWSIAPGMLTSHTKLEERIACLLDVRRNPVTRLTSTGWAQVCALWLGLAAAAFLGTATLVEASATAPHAGVTPVDLAAPPATTSSETAPVAPVSNTNAIVITGQAVDESGRPIPGARIVARTRPQAQETDTNDEGSFHITVDRSEVDGLVLYGTSRDDRLQAFHQFWADKGKSGNPSIQLTMRPPREIRVSVADSRQQPVPDAYIAIVVNYVPLVEGKADAMGAAVLRVPRDAPLQYAVAFQPKTGLDYFVFHHGHQPRSDPDQLAQDHREALTFVLNGTREVTVACANEEGEPMAGVRVGPLLFEKPRKGGYLNATGLPVFRSHSDDRGVTTLDVPIDNTQPITFQALTEGYFAPGRSVWNPESGTSKVVVRLARVVSISGQVTFADGSPGTGIDLRVNGDGYQRAQFSGTVRSGSDGRFTLRVYPYTCYQVVPVNEQWAAAPRLLVVHNQPVEQVNFLLREATRVHGRVTVGKDKQPLVGESVSLALECANYHGELAPSQQLPNPGGSGKIIAPNIWRFTATDEQGHFEFRVGPGRYVVQGPADCETAMFPIADQRSHELNLHAAGPDTISLNGQVVLRDDPKQAVAGARIFGGPIDSRFSRFRLRALSNEEGQFSAERGRSEMYVWAETADRRLAGIVKIAADQASVVIPVSAATTARGRLIDETTGQPMPGRWIALVSYIPGSQSIGGRDSTMTSARGEFTFTGLVRGQEYGLRVAEESEPDWYPPTWRPIAPGVSADAEIVELGDVRLSPAIP